jgi:raffinose/stachyose/melibiose transport system permease protein
MAARQSTVPPGPPASRPPIALEPPDPAGNQPGARNAREGNRRLRRAGQRPYPPGQPRRIGLLYVLPGAIVYTVFVLVPLGQTVWLSLFDWDGVTQGRYIGLSNYSTIAQSSQIRSAYEHTAILMAFYCVIPLVVGLMLAVTIARYRVRGATVYRAILFLPTVVATAAAAVAWIWIYQPQGPVDTALRGVGLGTLAQPWLGSFTYALPALGIVGAWSTTGLVMVLFIAGIQRIPRTLYDAAAVEGCGPLRELVSITLPALRNELSVALVVTITACLGSFDVVYIATSGGPGTASLVPSLAVFRYAFQYNQVGLACAASVVLTALILLLTVIARRLVGESAE